MTPYQDCFNTPLSLSPPGAVALPLEDHGRDDLSEPPSPPDNVLIDPTYKPPNIGPRGPKKKGLTLFGPKQGLTIPEPATTEVPPPLPFKRGRKPPRSSFRSGPGSCRPYILRKKEILRLLLCFKLLFKIIFIV